MKSAVAWACLLVGVIFEQMLWDDQIMQSPNELTVSAFEIEEEGLSVVLTNAIEDARVVASYTGRIDYPEMNFRAVRVLRLLEEMRNREAGRVV